MVSSIDRNWVGGLTSGLDTQALIDKLMQAERFPVDRLEQKRNTLDFQKTLLQDINLKLFNLQTKATDLTFSRTFNTKQVSSSNDRAVSALATTSAAVGSYTLHVKQLATTSTATSAFRLAKPLERGQNLTSSKQVGGNDITLADLRDGLGVTPGDIDINVSGAGVQNLALGLAGSDSVETMISRINQKIEANAVLKGKLAASFDEKNNLVRFTLLDSTKTMSFSDSGGGTIISQMFDGAGFTLDKNVPAKDSDPTLTTIRSGLNATMADLGLTLGNFTLQRGAGPLEVLDMSSLAAGSTVADLVRELNHQIDGTASLVKGGVPTGNPQDRLLEFRYDDATGKLNIQNTDSGDATSISLADGTGDLGVKMFGGAAVGSTFDQGLKLANESLATGVTAGTFTIDGKQISVDPLQDTLQNVLSRINALTNITATYDSTDDVLRLSRDDAQNSPIGLGSGSDTSNFLSALGLIGGSQAVSAQKNSSGVVVQSDLTPITEIEARTLDLNTLFGFGGGGTMRVTVGGVQNDLNYLGTETLTEFLDNVKAIAGVKDAYYDASTRTVSVTTDDKGSSATLKIEDVAGPMAGNLNLDNVEVGGLDVGSVLESRAGISGIQTATTLDKAGFSTPVTAGNFTINGVRFTISNPASMTMDSLLSAINGNANVGAKAEYDQVTGKLILTSLQPGNTTVSIGAPTDTSNFLSAAGLTRGVQNVGQNAVFSVDGLFGGMDLVRQSNSVGDVIDGVTLNFKDTTGPSGETITVSADTEYARTKVDEFLETYNEVIELVFNKLTEKRNWELEALTETQKNALSTTELENYEAQFQIGLLAGDSTLSTIRSRMRVTMAAIVPGIDSMFDTLTDIGISTGEVGSSYQDTQVGKLKVVDEEKLTAALRDNPDLVSDLFAKDSPSEGNMGIARRLKTVLNEFTKSDGILTRRVGRSGITSSNSEMGTQIRLINEQISRQEERLRSKEESLLQQFANLEKSLSTYQSQSAAFAQQLAQLSGGG